MICNNLVTVFRCFIVFQTCMRKWSSRVNNLEFVLPKVHMKHQTGQTHSDWIFNKTAKSGTNVFLVSESVSVCVCTWCMFACQPSLRLLFEDVIALLLSSSEWPSMDLRGLFSSQWPVQIVNRSPMNCGFSGFVSL